MADAKAPATSLVLSATSSNRGLVPTANVTFGGSGANRRGSITAVSGGTGTSLITIRVSDGQATGTVTVRMSVTGNGNDTVNGTAGSDILIGRNGNDILRGLGANDVLCGGGGDDRLNGGAGADRFSGGTGRDTAVDLTPRRATHRTAPSRSRAVRCDLACGSDCAPTAPDGCAAFSDKWDGGRSVFATT